RARTTGGSDDHHPHSRPTAGQASSRLARVGHDDLLHPHRHRSAGARVASGLGAELARFTFNPPDPEMDVEPSFVVRIAFRDTLLADGVGVWAMLNRICTRVEMIVDQFRPSFSEFALRIRPASGLNRIADRPNRESSFQLASSPTCLPTSPRR